MHFYQRGKVRIYNNIHYLFHSIKLIILFDFIDFPYALINNISILSGDFFWTQNKKVLLTLGCMDFDLMLCVDKLFIFMESSMLLEKTTYQYERSNRLGMMLIRSYMSIWGFIPEHSKVKNFIKIIEEQFVTSNKVLASTLTKRLLAYSLTILKMCLSK